MFLSGEDIFYDIIHDIIEVIKQDYENRFANNDTDHVIITKYVNTHAVRPSFSELKDYYKGWESLMKQTGYSKNGKYFFFGQNVLYKFPKYEITRQIRIRNVIKLIDQFRMKMKKVSDYFDGEGKDDSFTDYFNSIKPSEQFKRLLSLCRANTGRKFYPIIIGDSHIIEFVKKGVEYSLCSLKFKLDHVIYTCVACEDTFMEPGEDSCKKCCKNQISLCKDCKVQHIKAQIEQNVDNGSTPLDIKCLCGDFSFIKTFGAQNSSQYCHIHNSFDIGPLKDQILSLLRVWRYNMLQNWMNSKVISDKDKERFFEEQKALLKALKTDDPEIVARNCPGCGTCIVKSNGCNAVVCMNKSAGCTSRFCIACGKVFTNMARTEVCDCSGETQAITTHWFEPQHLREQMTDRVPKNKGYIKLNLAKLV